MEYSRFSSFNDASLGLGHWSELNYLKELSRIPELTMEKILSNQHVMGAVISGPPGSGRRAWVEAGMEKLENPPQLIRLNGSNFGTKVPLGALSYLLARLDLDDYTSRHELVHGLGRILCSENRPAAVMLGRPELIDEESSSLLAQLATMGKIKLFVICEQIQDLPGDLFALYRSGRIKHRLIHRMDNAETHQFVESELGGPASTFSSAVLRYLTSGSRELMSKLIQCWRDDGQLLQRNGSWILKLSGFGTGSATHGLYSLMTRGLDSREYDLMLAIALGGPVTLERIHLCELTESLDVLLNRGQVRYLPGASRRVGLCNPLLALLVRTDEQENKKESVKALLKQLHADPLAAQVLAQVQALSDMNDHQAQIAVAKRYQATGYGPDAWPADPKTRMKIVDMHVKALAMTSQFQPAFEVIEVARTGAMAARDKNAPDEALDAALQELDLLAQFVSHLEDEMSRTKSDISSTQELVESANWMNESLRLRALSVQASVWAARQRQADALKLTLYVDSRLKDTHLMSSQISTFDPEDAVDIEFELLQAELLSGHWNLALERSKKLASGFYSSPLSVTFSETVYGILLALDNDLDGAVAVLKKNREQLATGQRPLLPAIINAITAYELARSGQRHEASAMLERNSLYHPTVDVPVNFYRWVQEIFTALTHAEIGATDLALDMLKNFTTQMRGESHTLLESLTLGYRVRLGDSEALTDFLRASALCQGTVGEGMSQVAKAIAAGNSSCTAAGLGDLAKLGHVLFSTASNNRIFANLEIRDQRKISRIINESKRSHATQFSGMAAELEESGEYRPAWMRELTKREVQIAKLAIGGKSNAEIAKANGVSIRTIEGHLYQVYSKLQIRNRQELTALDRSSQGTAGLR